MSAPSPFDVGRAVGSNISGAFQRSRERSAIDDILTQVSQSNDPAQIDNAMRQILRNVAPERQQAAMGFLQGKFSQIQAQKDQERQNEAYRQSGLDPNLSESINKELIKKRTQEEAKQKSYKTSLDLIGRAKEIAKTGHLGPKIGIIGTGRKAGSTFSKEGQKLRSEYQQIGKALVQAAAPLKITNRAEFEHYAEDLEDPTKNLEDIEGSLIALERIIRSAAGKNDLEQTDIVSPSTNQPPSQRPPLESFYR